MTAFNCASYLSLNVPHKRDCLDLLRRGCSSHRQYGNLVLPDSSYTPHIVRFCTIDRPISVSRLVSTACTAERGLSSDSKSVSSPPASSTTAWRPNTFQTIVGIKRTHFQYILAFLASFQTSQGIRVIPSIKNVIIAKPVSIELLAPSRPSMTYVESPSST